MAFVMNITLIGESCWAGKGTSEFEIPNLASVIAMKVHTVEPYSPLRVD